MIKSREDFISSLFVDPNERFEAEPNIYYFVKQNKGWNFIGYSVYHYIDKSAMHNHDFEGILFAIDGTNYGTIATVAHLNFHFCMSRIEIIKSVMIEPGGHAIHPFFGKFESWRDKNHITYRNFGLVNMDDPDKFNWKNIQNCFGESVKLPDKYVDMQIEAYIEKETPTIADKFLTTSRGLWYHRPDILFELARKLERI